MKQLSTFKFQNHDFFWILEMIFRSSDLAVSSQTFLKIKLLIIFSKDSWITILLKIVVDFVILLRFSSLIMEKILMIKPLFQIHWLWTEEWLLVQGIEKWYQNEGLQRKTANQCNCLPD